MFTPVTASTGTHIITYTYTDSLTTCAASSTQSVIVNSCAGIDEYGFENNTTIYANPANEIVNITISNASFKQLTISIIDIQGRVVYNFEEKNISSDYHKQINLEGLAKGVYYLKLTNGTDINVQKLVIQ